MVVSPAAVLSASGSGGEAVGGEVTRSAGRSQGTTTSAAALESGLSTSLRAELEVARWFQGKGRGLHSLRLVDHVTVPGSGGGILAVVSAGYADGSKEEYALAVRADATGAIRGADTGDALWPALARLALDGGSVTGDHGIVEGTAGSPLANPLAVETCRRLEADQSNTSVVLDGRIVLKCYRRLWVGPHPEQELLEGLTRVGSKRAPTLLGGLVYRRDDGGTAIATAYAFVEGEPVGWERAIVRLTAALGGPAAELEQLAVGTAELGSCAGELHADLLRAFGGGVGSPAEARAAQEQAGHDLDGAIEVVGQAAPAVASLAPAARRELDGLERLAGAPTQRVHGDLHVAQLLRGGEGVVAIDFEGDPTLPPESRRRLASPLKDVASLLLSLDHVGAAAARRRGFGAATAQAFRWSSLARDAVLAAYDATAPHGAIHDPALLQALEVDKEWREAVYAVRVLPEWLYAPRLVLEKLLA